MARPTKQGIDYFNLDVHLDDKFKYIEIKYKLEGFAIVIKMLQKIYSVGYWYPWSDDEAMLFSDEIRADYRLVIDVINEAINRNVFNKQLYDKYKILTSRGIQKRYREAVRRRKDIEVIEEYLLIDNDFGVIDNKNKINDNINPSTSKHDDGKSTQKKQHNNKQHEIKETIPYAEIINYLNEKANKKFKSTAKKTRDVIRARWNEGNKLEDFKKVIDICVEEWTGKTFSSGKPGDVYLQPSTLFNNKFDERLNWTSKQQPKKPDPRDKEIEFQQWIANGKDPENFTWN